MCIVIVPTSHIAAESIKEIKKAITHHKPDIVAVELDIHRFMMMEEEKKSSALDFIRTSGIINFFLYYTMRKLQEWLGKSVNVFPGSDMLTAINMAEEMGIEVDFIDRDIGYTMLRINSAPRKEKLKLIWFLFKGFFAGTLFSRFCKNKVDLTKLPSEEIIEHSMKTVKKEFPAIYNALVDERDEYMSRKLRELSKKPEARKIVAVVGAGHKQGIEKRIKDLLCKK